MVPTAVQTPLFEPKISSTDLVNGNKNKLHNGDNPVHNWYRFVLSFPPHLVREYLEKFNADKNQIVLDPFCGTGTTLVECKKLGIGSVGIEAIPVAHFAAQVKINWSPDPKQLRSHSRVIADLAEKKIKNGSRNLMTLDGDQMKILLKDSISPLPLHKALSLLETIRECKKDNFYKHELLAFVKSLVFDFSNLHFGPEVGVSRTKKEDVDVVNAWLENIMIMADDIEKYEQMTSIKSEVRLADSRSLTDILPRNSVDFVITSPPYPNEKDYTRTTRLESVILGFINNREDLRLIKKSLLRSNSRGVYRGDNDDDWILKYPEIQNIAEQIEKRREELGKTSGFERMYHRVVKLYFGGMARHLANLKKTLRPNAHLAYVVGDQASYLRVMIRTGNILADIAHDLGYEVLGIDLFRTRLATATRAQLREEVVLLRWPGN